MNASFLFVFLLLIAVFPCSAFALNVEQLQDLNAEITNKTMHACSEDGYFLRCYQIQDDECREIASKSLKSCFNMREEQMKQDSKKSVKDWFPEIIDCAKRDMKNKLKDKKNVSKSCK